MFLQAKKSEAQILKTKGNALFKEKKFEDALISYTDGLHICPLCYARDRSLLYSNRAACKMHLVCTLFTTAEIIENLCWHMIAKRVWAELLFLFQNNMNNLANMNNNLSYDIFG